MSDKTKTTLDAAEAISGNVFSALTQSFGPFPDHYHFAIAVSGGPDSMALALCAKRWADEKHFKPLAFIVDHALRPESAQEAMDTANRLKAIGLSAEILCWEHPPITTKLHISARKARYNLLTEACKRHGITDLWLAHQREDQAETILMRIAKGTGIDGLAGISAMSSLNGIRLLRPFLSVPKENLIATCQGAKLDFIEDKSNQSGKFARGRLRRIMPLLADEGFTVDRLVDLGARASDAKDALNHYTNLVLREATSRDDAGVIRIELEALRTAPRAIAGRVLSLCLQGIHADDYAPEYVSLMRLLDALRNVDEMQTCTLQGCIVSKSVQQATLVREISVITDAPTITPGETVIWDGRWSVILSKDSTESFAIRPLGTVEHNVLDQYAPSLRRHIPQGRARAGLPALYQGNKLVLIPSLKDDGPALARLVSLWPPR